MESPKSATWVFPETLMRMLVDLMLPWVRLLLWMNAIPCAVWVAIFSLVVQSSGVRPGPRLPVTKYNN